MVKRHRRPHESARRYERSVAGSESVRRRSSSRRTSCTPPCSREKATKAKSGRSDGAYQGTRPEHGQVPVESHVLHPAGAKSHTHVTLLLGTLPKHFVLCCRDNDVYSGSYDKNPFQTKHNDVKFLAVYVDGRQVQS